MAPIATTEATPPEALAPCPHAWTPIQGWFARYRCTHCGAIGYKPRVVTALVDGGPFGSSHISPYVCAATRNGVRCGACAVVKRKGSAFCAEHRPGAKTHAARAQIASKSAPAQRNPGIDGTLSLDARVPR